MEPSLKNLTKSKFGKAKQTQNKLLQTLGKHHIDSFNFFVEHGIHYAVSDIWPVEFVTMNNTRIKLMVEDAKVHPPRVPSCSLGSKTTDLYPSECRQRNINYSGRLEVRLAWWIDNKRQMPLDIDLANIPVMLKSKLCNLRNLSPSELIRRGEHADEWGGYFVVKGKERLVRMLLNTRRNYPIAVRRTSWKNRDASFSDLGIMIRCVSDDETSTNNVLHFLTNGTAKLMLSFQKNLFYVPVILIIKCLVDYCDEFVFKHIISGFENDTYMKGCVIEMMQQILENGICNQSDARNYIGKLFRVKFNHLLPWKTDGDICNFILKNCVLIHLNDNVAKFRLLVVMLQKLLQAAQGHCLVENPDSIMFQELLLGGHLYLKILKEKLQSWLYSIKAVILKQDKRTLTLNEKDLLNLVKKAEHIEQSLTTFFATGNLVSNSGLGLQQDKGLTIMVENISRIRYMSHFRAVHRGSIFEEMRMTEPRQLLPDAWGFICPVHTPDGTPCGLLNHLTRTCEVADAANKTLLSKLPSVLVSFGMMPVTTSPLADSTFSSYLVMLDGRLIGHIIEPLVHNLVKNLRLLKTIGTMVPSTLEIVLLERKEDSSIAQFPGLFLQTGSARMMRPVLNLDAGNIELIGTFEQVYLDISISAEDIIPGVSTHQELEKDNFLSFAASLIPMPDYNQSPRNMYQCQMAKQTMGTACHNWRLQSDTKLYRLQTPTSPLFRPIHHDLLEIDDFGMGTNAIVAVISYTAYDMEDAMIINKTSLERGFAHGQIYKSSVVELKSDAYFALEPNKQNLADKIDKDGLPFIGARLKPDDLYYSYYDTQSETYSVGKYTGKEEVIVDSIRLCGDFTCDKSSTKKAFVTFRIPRNPSVGDKFASRAGQKGIFSMGYQTENLPFTESGLVPDIVFNPHGFPSRMTIAMMIECMAGKSAALHGLVHDASPFRFTEKDTAIDYFGKLLESSGYNYYGNEIMYSGVDGTEMPAAIFFGVVHYQRLRHMVSDKWQVRNTGPVDVLTKQPLKGRKRGGGGRVGEMERDALISHGVSYLLHDRLNDCSDKSVALLCTNCQTLVGPSVLMLSSTEGYNVKNISVCRICNNSTYIKQIGVPYIFRYLSAELASVNIKLKFTLEGDTNIKLFT